MNRNDLATAIRHTLVDAQEPATAPVVVLSRAICAQLGGEQYVRLCLEQEGARLVVQDALPKVTIL